MAIVILVLCAIPWLHPFKNYRSKSWWNIIIPLAFLFLVFFYAADYYHYDYLQQRLNASVLSYTADAAISLNMMWQTYPVIWIALLFLAIVILATLFFKQLLTRFQQQTPVHLRKNIGLHILMFVLLALGIFGKIGQFNLRWSDAFLLNDPFKASMALNPFQSFFSTLSYRNTKPDIKTVKSVYPYIAKYLGVQQPDSNTLNYDRIFEGNTSIKNKPNIVLVICESFSMYKSSMSGNPYNTTPFFNQLTKKGIFFDRCYTPSFPTARGVWATVTSIPDVLGDNNRTASRNPEVVDQHTIINNFIGYKKMYFLGGDPTWANIKGLLMGNIDSLALYSQENFKAKKVDVWGIDDKNLFLEANLTMAKEKEPFFAIIQTADNHRPYTIPEADLAFFKKVQYPTDSVSKYGFDDNDQLNAFRYTDFCFEQFMQAAAKEKYYDNTIFVFVGDHGIPGDARNIYPQSWTNQSLTRVHVPLLFYAPKILQPKAISKVSSQLDILPTLASLVGIGYRNHSMGKNLFDSTQLNQQHAFVIDHEARTIGVVTDAYYYLKNMRSGKVDFVSVQNNDAIPLNAFTDSIKNSLSIFTTAFYETSRYLLFNNKKHSGK
ncbi:MAG: LTA synthase family protein [Ferruginibacter sp.]